MVMFLSKVKYKINKSFKVCNYNQGILMKVNKLKDNLQII